MPDKGTIISISAGRAVIMNQRCGFEEIRIEGRHQPGDEIEYSPGEVVSPRRLPVKILALAASILICCLAGFYAFSQMLAGEAVAYVGLEINPSLEIGLDKNHRIISVTGFNDDGKALIQKSGLLQAGLEEALGDLVRQGRESGYLSADRQNYIAVSLCVTGGGGGELLERINQSLQAGLAERGVGARMYYFNLDRETRDRAVSQNTSPLRYFLWLEAQRRGYAIPLQQVTLADPRLKELAGQAAGRVEEKKAPAPRGASPVAPAPTGKPLPEGGKSPSGFEGGKRLENTPGPDLDRSPEKEELPAGGSTKAPTPAGTESQGGPAGKTAVPLQDRPGGQSPVAPVNSTNQVKPTGPGEATKKDETTPPAAPSGGNAGGARTSGGGGRK